jgi:hypothetical protein
MLFRIIREPHFNARRQMPPDARPENALVAVCKTGARAKGLSVLNL